MELIGYGVNWIWSLLDMELIGYGVNWIWS